MPASSRIGFLFGYRSPLHRNRGLHPSRAGLAGAPAMVANGLWGGHLRAAADDTNARIRVDLYWPGIDLATVERVHADGSSYPVRGGDPGLVLGAWARWDYEAPLDQAVTYRATSPQRGDAVAEAGPVTVASGGRHWLKNVAQPSLNTKVTIADRGERALPARRGVLRPPLRPDPIVVYQVRGLDTGTVAIYTPDKATETAVRALLADGSPLLLQYPAAAGGESLYLSVDTAALKPPVRVSTDLQQMIALPFDAIGRPPGAAGAGPGDSYAALAEVYPTFDHQAASGLSYLELSMLG